jgi:hypothetical protein
VTDPAAPEPLRGWKRAAALAWVAAVVLLHLAVRELGLELVR